ncbi:MAG TPA: glycosyltransferase family 4 protein [bacterium]|nr:glycosyltransferase family 4 protein [bacterium]
MALVSLAWHRQGGIERCVWAEAEALAGAGVEVHVFAGNVEEAGASPLPGVFLHRVPLPAHPWIARLFFFALRAPAAVAAHGPFDLVHAHTVYLGRADLATAHSVHRRAVAMDPPAPGWRRCSAWLKGLPPLSVALSDRTYRQARVRVAISRSIAKELKECYPREAEPTEILYYGVDHSMFKPLAPAARLRLRKSLGLDQGPWSLFCGWNWRRKGLDLLLDAMRELPQARLLVLGEDVLEGGHFRALARDRGLGERVRFAGRQADVAPWFQACELFVFPTRYEPFGMVISEAMACGLPVLVPEAAGASEIIRSRRKEQVLADGAAATDWGRAWGALLASAPLRRSLGRVNLAAARGLDWAGHGRGLMALYASLDGGRA